MFELIKPPTDNLYKFQALAGLLLSLVSLIYPTWLYHQALLRYLAAKNEETELQTQRDYVQKRLDILQSRMSMLLDDPVQLKKFIDDLEKQRLLTASPSKRAVLSSEIEGLRKRWQDSVQNQTALTETSDELKLGLRSREDQLAHQKTISDTELSLSRTIIYFGLVGVLVGIFITLRGFNKWSKRVQVFQDAILKKQASENPTADTKMP